MTRSTAFRRGAVVLLAAVALVAADEAPAQSLFSTGGLGLEDLGTEADAQVLGVLGQVALGELRLEVRDRLGGALAVPLDVLRELRRRPETNSVPIILLTARREESDRIQGLELGADDYLAKPSIPRVLVARIRAILRRAE